ncbi:MAG: Xenobiotic-transporting ATPase, partial [Firmicutes bacterium]|nr:Xenobiotic-transporting ATPase [Bacillota bacterium]
KIMGSFHAGNNFFEGLLYVTVLVFGGVFIANGTMQLTDLAVYALYIGIFINPLDVLINFTEQFQKGYAGFKRFVDVLQTEPEIVDKEDAISLTNVRGEIAFKDVSFYYDKTTEVLEKVTISIEAGKTVALVGPSGGGKTTLCSLLPRFYDVTEGSVTIDGKDVRDVTLKSLRSNIGIVQQDVYMFAGSVRDNISYGKPKAAEEEIIKAAKNANIHDFIMSLDYGYDTYVGERGVRLSGGQKQRLAIARVFLKNPKILILDEATSALDNESERHIQASLEQLSKDRTTIVIAHRLSTIRNADEIIVINDRGIQEFLISLEIKSKFQNEKCMLLYILLCS